MVTMKSLTALKQQVVDGNKLTVLTAYDATFAQRFSNLGIDILLVGDSLGMVIQGQDSTLPVTMNEMLYHMAAVARGNQGALLMADMPFNSYGTLEQCLANAGQLMQAGAHVVKLEGGAWLEEQVVALSRAGIPTCLHLGLTPQSVNKFGGYKVQGRDDQAAQHMINDAITLVEAGADFILLECVPSALAKAITESVPVPVIGIGAGKETDAQVLVCYDMLGLTTHRLPRFVKNYMADNTNMDAAVSQFIEEVRNGTFPAAEHSYD